MDDQLVDIFRSEAALQCKFALRSAQDVDAAIEALDAIDYQMTRVPGEPGPWQLNEHWTTELWRALQAILVASANLSKMCWGSQGRLEAERARLREALQVAHDSPIRDPDLRNDFEHFDERLERWWKQQERKIYVGRMIGPSNTVVIAGDDAPPQFQRYDPTTGTVTFWGHSTALGDLIREVARIHDLARVRA